MAVERVAGRRWSGFATEPDEAPIGGDVLLLDANERRMVGFQVTLPTHAAPWDGILARFNDLTFHDGRTSSRGGARMAGFQSPNRTFGFTPKNVIRNRYGAQMAGVHTDDPPLGRALAALGSVCWDETERRLPTLAQAHRDQVTQIGEPWRMGMWTSGIINRKAQLPYHRDAGNLPGCLSAMVTWRNNVAGGALHLADYGVWLAVPDRSLTVFLGAGCTHGVTPLHPGRGPSWRYTAVWYVRAQLQRAAQTVAEEMRRAQLLATTHDEMPV